MPLPYRLLSLLLPSLARRLAMRIIRPLRVHDGQALPPTGVPVQRTTLITTDGLRLAALFAPATAQKPNANLIVLHGKDGCKQGYLDYAARLSPLGYNVLLYDQRGHGASEGMYTTYGYHERRDVLVALNYLRYRNDAAQGRELPTGVLGHSMGGAVALQALARYPDQLAFGIVESSFTHLGDIVLEYARRAAGIPLPRWLTDGLLDEAERIANFQHREVEPVRHAREVRQPTLVIHGSDDRQIAPRHGRQLYDALPGPHKDFYLVAGAGHDDPAACGGQEYWRRLDTFMTQALDT